MTQELDALLLVVLEARRYRRSSSERAVQCIESMISVLGNTHIGLSFSHHLSGIARTPVEGGRGEGIDYIDKRSLVTNQEIDRASISQEQLHQDQILKSYKGEHKNNCASEPRDMFMSMARSCKVLHH